MKLKIKSIEGFHSFIKSIKSVADGAVFIVSKNGCVVKSRNESASIRAYFRTNVVQVDGTDDIVHLPMLDLSKMLQAVKMVVETSKDDADIMFNVTKQFLTYNGKAKFKLKVYNEAHLAFHTTNDIKQTTDSVFNFSISSDLFKYLLRYKGITGEKDPKIYFYEKDGNIIAEHDDKTQNLIDSVGITLTDEFEGELRNPLCININNNFSKFNPLGADVMNMSLQTINGKPAFVKVTSAVKGDSFVNVVELVSKILEK